MPDRANPDTRAVGDAIANSGRANSNTMYRRLCPNRHALTDAIPDARRTNSNAVLDRLRRDRHPITNCSGHGHTDAHVHRYASADDGSDQHADTHADSDADAPPQRQRNGHSFRRQRLADAEVTASNGWCHRQR